MYFNTIRENKILAKNFGFIILASFFLYRFGIFADPRCTFGSDQIHLSALCIDKHGYEFEPLSGHILLYRPVTQSGQFTVTDEGRNTPSSGKQLHPSVQSHGVLLVKIMLSNCCVSYAHRFLHLCFM